MSRYEGPEADEMTVKQRSIYNAIAASRGTGVKGPFKPWLSNPEIADCAQRLGKCVRYDLNCIDRRETEMVILMTAVHYKCLTEYSIHYDEALKEGLQQGIIAKLHDPFVGPDFPLWAPATLERDVAIYNFAKAALTDSSNIHDEIYKAAEALVGGPGIVELVSLIGYYALVAMTLNVFQIGNEEGKPPPSSPGQKWGSTGVVPSAAVASTSSPSRQSSGAGSGSGKSSQAPYEDPEDKEMRRCSEAGVCYICRSPTHTMNNCPMRIPPG